MSRYWAHLRWRGATERRDQGEVPSDTHDRGTEQVGFQRNSASPRAPFNSSELAIDPVRRPLVDGETDSLSYKAASIASEEESLAGEFAHCHGRAGSH